MQSRPLISCLHVAPALVLVLTACTTTTRIDNYQRSSMGAIEHGEAVVVLREPHLAARETENDFIDCVGKALSRSDDALRVIPRGEFVDGMYPYFEDGTAPVSVEGVSKLAENPVARERMAGMNLRYLVWIDGFTANVDGTGSMSCAISPAGGGCLGWTAWTNEGAYTAEIWDLKLGIEAGSFELDARGTSHLIGLLVPIPLLANVKGNACSAVAHWIAFSVRGG